MTATRFFKIVGLWKKGEDGRPDCDVCEADNNKQNWSNYRGGRNNRLAYASITDIDNNNNDLGGQQHNHTTHFHVCLWHYEALIQLGRIVVKEAK